jgi:2-C-methyl-D-erythritol 4-phosphate cytidylyltransferase
VAHFAIVVVAAGSSVRMGYDKVWAELAGRPVVSHALAAAGQAEPDELVLVVAADREDLADGMAPRVVAGGARRRDSVLNGVQATSADWIAIHDAARALVPSALFRAGLEAAQATGCAVPGIPVKDTLKEVAANVVTRTPDRAGLVAVQTPQLFRRDILLRALASTDEDATDEAGLVERLGISVAVFPGHEDAFKITTPLDFVLAEALVQRRAGDA